jgi:hypothetical protein
MQTMRFTPGTLELCNLDVKQKEVAVEGKEETGNYSRQGAKEEK